MMIRFASIWKLIKLTFKEFAQDKPLDYAAIIGFYTIFSLPAVLIILIRIAGAAFGQEAVRGEVVNQISDIVGRNSAEQIQSIIENASLSPASTFGTVVGVCTMAFTATTVFVALQDALNTIWEVKAKAGKSWMKLIIGRLLSLALVVSLGFLLLVSLSAEVILGLLNDYFQEAFSGMAVYLVTTGNQLLSLLVSIAIFATIFKVLPDAHIRWSSVWVGAFVTAILFVIGKYGIHIFLQYEPLSDTYGAASSMVLLLVWVYYTSIILLLGAEFTQVYSKENDQDKNPSEQTDKVEKYKVEKDN